MFRACISLRYVSLSELFLFPSQGVQVMFRRNPFILSASPAAFFWKHWRGWWSLGGISTALPSACTPDWQVNGNGCPQSCSWDWGGTRRGVSHSGNLYVHWGCIWHHHLWACARQLRAYGGVRCGKMDPSHAFRALGERPLRAPKMKVKETIFFPIWLPNYLIF
jgi:hypothetical protein